MKHSITCQDPCPGAFCQCDCHTCTCPCGHPVADPGLWLVPSVPPGQWTDRCGQECAKRSYDEAVMANTRIDNIIDNEVRAERGPLQYKGRTA